MRSAICLLTAIATLLLGGAESAQAQVGAKAQVRAKADIACKPAVEKLHYECIFKLANARTSEPLSGLGLMVGADMPSMPAAHNVRPVKATEDEEGTYKARIVLEMYGDWALRLDLSGAVRDRIIKVLRFQSDHVGEATPAPSPGGRRH
jgi:hypothetical protein